MIPPRIALTDTELDTLATGGGGRALAALLARARRATTLTLLAMAVREDPRALPAWRTLAAVRRAAPSAADRVLDDPVTGAWAAGTARGRAPAAELAHIAAAAAIRAGIPVEVDFPGGEGVLPSLGRLTAPVTGRVRSDRLRWLPAPVVAIPGGPEFTLTELPPSVLPPGLPQGSITDPALWADRLRAGWHVLTETDPNAAAEFATLITTFAPLRGDGSDSSTVTDALGCVFLGPNPDAEELAVTLLHELQHSKLAALMDIHPLTTGTGEPRYYAPWRLDPRPAAGLLHGVYAFQGVAGFWRARHSTGSGDRATHLFARWRAGALTAACTLLAGNDLTPHGRRFVDTAAHQLLRWSAEVLPANALRAAAHDLATHRATSSSVRDLASGPLGITDPSRERPSRSRRTP